MRTPAHINAYVTVLGDDLAVEFLLEFGGAELSLSSRPRDGRLVQLIGKEKAVALAQQAGHLPRRIPLAKPWVANKLRDRGLSVAEIARKMHVSDVSVRSYLKNGPKRPPPDPRQYSLI